MRALSPWFFSLPGKCSGMGTAITGTKSLILFQPFGPTKEAAEKLIGLKGTGFSPSVITLMNVALATEGTTPSRHRPFMQPHKRPVRRTNNEASMQEQVLTDSASVKPKTSKGNTQW